MYRPSICFDLDGTLLDREGHIHPNDVALLTSPNPPALFIPATGRPPDSVKRALARHNLFVNRAIPLPMVLQNGSLLFAEHEARLMYEPFEPAVQAELMALAMRHRHVTFFCLGSRDTYVLWPGPDTTKLATYFDLAPRPFEEYNGQETFSKVMCMSANRPDLDALSAAMAGAPVERAFSLPYFLEITPRGITKAHGIRKLLHAMHRETQSIYAAGDGENDLAMFEIATSSFAPTTAPAHIKDRAAHVIDVSSEGLLAPILKIAC